MILGLILPFFLNLSQQFDIVKNCVKHKMILKIMQPLVSFI
jgi:hypothetical protein